MKKIILSFILMITTIISGYFIFVWSPKAVTTESKVVEGYGNLQSKGDNASVEEGNEKYRKVIKNIGKTIDESLLDEDKTELYKYINNFSVTDVALIEEYMNTTNDYNSIKEMLRIFKGRLGSKEYGEVRAILSKYIKVDIIEKEIN